MHAAVEAELVAAASEAVESVELAEPVVAASLVEAFVEPAEVAFEVVSAAAVEAVQAAESVAFAFQAELVAAVPQVVPAAALAAEELELELVVVRIAEVELQELIRPEPVAVQLELKYLIALVQLRFGLRDSCRCLLMLEVHQIQLGE